MSSIPPVENLDAAEAAAARVVLGKLNLQLALRDVSARGLSQSPAPLYGVTWNRDVINLVAQDPVNNLFVRLRNSFLPRAEYDRLSTFPMQITAPPVPSQLSLGNGASYLSVSDWKRRLAAPLSFQKRLRWRERALISHRALQLSSRFANVLLGRKPFQLCGAWRGALSRKVLRRII